MRVAKAYFGDLKRPTDSTKSPKKNSKNGVIGPVVVALSLGGDGPYPGMS